MTSRIRTCMVLAGMMPVLPPVVLAQEVLLTGTITDTTGAVLPGLTVQATHEGSVPRCDVKSEMSAKSQKGKKEKTP